MQGPRLFPVVEITTRPFKGNKRQSSVPSHEFPRKKKRLEVDTKFHLTDKIPNGVPIPNSPTVSDFGRIVTNGSPPPKHALVGSPTVSDMAGSPDTDIIDLTLDSSSDGTLTEPEIHISRPQTMPIASGSNVKREIPFCSPGNTTLGSPSRNVSKNLPSIRTSRTQVVSSGRENSSVSTSPDPLAENVEVEQDHYVYEIQNDEYTEDDDLIIHGETVLESGEAALNDLPVRLLTDFTIYEMSTSIAVPLGELTGLELDGVKDYGASGIATAWTDDDDKGDDDLDDDDSDSSEGGSNLGERVKLSKIVEFNIHHYSKKTKKLDSKLYIRTKYAWYILGIPSDSYKAVFFIPFWIQHRILHLLVAAAIDRPRITYDEFIESLQFSEDADESVTIAYTFLRRELTGDDVESADVKAYVIAHLPDLCQRNGLTLDRVPLIKAYFGPSEVSKYFDDVYSSPSSPNRKKPAVPPKRETKDKEVDVLKHRNVTVVTPIVSGIAKNLFKGSFEVAGESTLQDRDEGVAAEIDNIQAHHSNPKNMSWGHNHPEEGKYYESLQMDGVTYHVGDDVMVNPGDDEDMIRARNSQSDASQSVNLYANRLWFCRICYFFEEVRDGKRVKMFHGQWFVHGSKTILQETAHSKSLFLTYKCESNPAASIFKKCKVKMMTPEDAEMPDDGEPESNDFHCSLVYSEKYIDFCDLPSGEDLDRLLNHRRCIACAVREERLQMKLKSIPGGFTQCGVKYHCLDYIYVRPHDGNLLSIAQIMKVRGFPENPYIKVRYFGRYDDTVLKQTAQNRHSTLISDERHLYLLLGTSSVKPDEIDGICYVRQLRDADEIDSWVKYDNHFYVNQEEEKDGSLVDLEEGTLGYCTTCYSNRVKENSRNEELADKNVPIIGLELFSGAGGLGTGMDMSGFVETRYAVEFSPSAAITYQANHPHTTVYCQDSSLLLKHAIEADSGKHPKPLVSNTDGKIRCPLMPKKGEVDIIYGGPPCQSFSRANHNPRADDIRSTLPGNMLSYVEFYDPNYFLLENVSGLLFFPLMSTSAKDGRTLEGGIKSGVVKFILRSLIALGYQVRYNLLQAGQYGAPQSRRRVIFLGAKRGIKLPAHPVPMYALKRGMHRTTLPTGGYLLPVSRSRFPDDFHQYAPLPAITVNDAVSDLPPFEWINPHDVIPEKPKDRKEALERRRDHGIKPFDAVIGPQKSQNLTLPGFTTGVEYATKPMNRYQRWLRQEMDIDQKVEGHYTKRFGTRLIEATVTVPLVPLSDHRDLPLALQPNHAKPGARQEKKSFYGRMDGEGQFKCAMTMVAPNMKGSWVLHPSQKRIVSVRECARAQGFPDHYIFKSIDKQPQKTVTNQMRQIGNAVPVPLALALGKSLGASLLQEWDKKEREGSPVV